MPPVSAFKSSTQLPPLQETKALHKKMPGAVINAPPTMPPHVASAATSIAPRVVQKITNPNESKIPPAESSLTYKINLALVVDSIKSELLLGIAAAKISGNIKPTIEDLAKKGWLGKSGFHEGYYVSHCDNTIKSGPVEKMRRVWREHTQAHVIAGHVIHFFYSSKTAEAPTSPLQLANLGRCTFLSKDAHIGEPGAPLGLMDYNLHNLYSYVTFRQSTWTQSNVHAYIQSLKEFEAILATTNNPAGKNTWLKMINALNRTPDFEKLGLQMLKALDNPAQFFLFQELTIKELQLIAQFLLEISVSDFEKEPVLAATLKTLAQTSFPSSSMAEIHERSTKFEAAWLELYRRQLVRNFYNHLSTATFPPDKPIFCLIADDDKEAFHSLLNKTLTAESITPNNDVPVASC